MNPAPPALRAFRIDERANGLVHLHFDLPERSVNVFTDSAIHELAEFARWLGDCDARGVLIRSAKESGFCVGADLGELGSAYEMIMRAPEQRRFDTAFDHFFTLSHAIRALETAGKPVAVAIAGLALGGGCELALGAHHRVLADAPRAMLGLPESLVGLLPGGGGTQRLPRLVGLERSLPVLLDGARLSGRAAVEAGLVDQLVPAGQEIAAAEDWLLQSRACRQVWDRSDYEPPTPADIAPLVTARREAVLGATLGHYPAPLAILDCLEFGLPQTFEGAIRSEMAIFSRLIQRPEPRNMIRALFAGKSEYERLVKRKQLPPSVGEVVRRVRQAFADRGETAAALSAAGVGQPKGTAPVRRSALPGYWFEGHDRPSGPADPRCGAAGAVFAEIDRMLESLAAGLSPQEQQAADYAAIAEAGYPAYVGGPFAFRASSRRRHGGAPTGP